MFRSATTPFVQILFVIIALALSAAPARAQSAPALNNNRWAEDWSGVDNVPYKNMELGDGIAVDLGADARWKAESVDNARLGFAAHGDDSWLQQRLLGHANVRFGRDVRAFVQFGAYDVIGRQTRGPRDDNRFDLQQGFVDVAHSFGGARATLRVGRQEMEIDRDHFIELGDTSNIRQHFDTARLWLEFHDWKTQAFSAAQIRDEPGVFDDTQIDGPELFGFKAERTYGDLATAFYYVDYARENLSIAGATANERRRTLAAQFSGRRGPWDFDAEILRQTGDFGAQSVEAWGVNIDGGRRFRSARWSPRVGARLTYGSGDSDPNDGRLETYAPPVPRGSWFSDAGFSSFSNVIEVAATVEAKPNDALTLSGRLSALWRAEDGDFAYTSPQAALPGTRGGDRLIGVAPMAQARWRVNAHVEARVQAVYFDVSDRIADAGGRNSAYVNASIAYRY